MALLSWRVPNRSERASFIRKGKVDNGVRSFLFREGGIVSIGIGGIILLIILLIIIF